MNIHPMYFSPTGGTKKVVQVVAQAFGGTLCEELDLSVAGFDYTACTFVRENLCIVGVPSFGGRVPTAVLTHLKQIKAGGTPTVLIAAYGSRDYDDTLLELKEILMKNGFRVVAAIAAVTEHSIMRQFGAGRPDDSDQQQLQGYVAKIKQALEGGSALPTVDVKGNSPYRAFDGMPLKPKAGKACTECGACAKVCPTNAIPAEHPSETDKERCITCMRCVAACPQHARGLNKLLLLAASKKMEKACSGRKENELFLGNR